MNIFKQVSDSLSEATMRLTRTEEVKNWLNQIQDALKREKKWREAGAKVVSLYEQQRGAVV